MLIECPYCGEKIALNGLGRKALDIPLINVYDALRVHKSVQGAAYELRCSRAYVYKILKTIRLTPADVINGRITKKELLSMLG